jgi:cyclopropane fatty-acyl-phospholipid synthase-like methyltransferase
MRRQPDWHREAIGGLWDTIGQLQFQFLVKQGMKPHHRLLDIGCGSLRGGVHAIAYLDAGNYYGVDKESDILEAGRTVELKRYGLESKRPVLMLVDHFEFSVIQAVRFDYMIAQSVFTHLTPEQIDRCVTNAMPLLKSAGTFFATFHISSDQPDVGKPHNSRVDERDRTKYPVQMFRDLAVRRGIACEYVGEWGHPRGQQMLAFRHAAAQSRPAQSRVA